VGKHAAPDGAARHPLVSDALASRQDRRGAHSEDAAREGGLGWPDAPAPEGGGLGWPGDLPTGDSEDAQEPAAPTSRGGWRRFFGLGRVA
jgi:hypothetical protein